MEIIKKPNYNFDFERPLFFYNYKPYIETNQSGTKFYQKLPLSEQVSSEPHLKHFR